MDRTEGELLAEYNTCKSGFLTTAHEAIRAKDEQYSRAMSFHEAWAAQVNSRVTSLVKVIDDTKVQLQKLVLENTDYQDTIDVLNRAVLHYTFEPASSSIPEVQHQLMQLLHREKRFNVSSPDDVVNEIVFLRESLRSQLSTQEILKAEVTVLRRALELIVSRSVNAVKAASTDLVNALVKDAEQDLSKIIALREDPYLMQLAEQRQKDLFAITNAQHEIEMLNEERARLSTALEKSEQDAIQMKLKMMERDGLCAELNKNLRASESKHLSDIRDLSSKNSLLQQMSGEQVAKYEKEIRGFRIRVNALEEKLSQLSSALENQMMATQAAKDETEEVRAQIEVARAEGLQSGLEQSSLQLIELRTKLNVVTSEKLHWQGKFNETHESLQKEKENIGDLRSQLAKIDEQLTLEVEKNKQLTQDVQEMSKSPFAKMGSRGSDRQTSSPSGLLTVGPLVQEAVLDSQEGRSENAIRKLSSRLAKVHNWSIRSEKARHPSVVQKLNTAVHELARGMLSIASREDASPTENHRKPLRGDDFIQRNEFETVPTPSSSENDDEDVLFPKVEKNDVSIQCRADVQDKAVQAIKDAKPLPTNLRRRSTKITLGDAVTLTQRNSPVESPLAGAFQSLSSPVYISLADLEGAVRQAIERSNECVRVELLYAHRKILADVSALEVHNVLELSVLRSAPEIATMAEAEKHRAIAVFVEAKMSSLKAKDAHSQAIEAVTTREDRIQGACANVLRGIVSPHLCGFPSFKDANAIVTVSEYNLMASQLTSLMTEHNIKSGVNTDTETLQPFSVQHDKFSPITALQQFDDGSLFIFDKASPLVNQTAMPGFGDTRLLFEIIGWFITEAQKFVLSKHLPGEEPILLEDRPLASIDQCQSKLENLLGALRSQKEEFALLSNKRTKKKKCAYPATS